MPRSNKPSKPRRWLTLAALLLAALCSLGAGPPILHSGHDQPLRLTAGQLAARSRQAAGPQIAASAAALADRADGALLWARDADTPRAPGSAIKLMTALAALETLSPQDVVIVPPAALIGEASMGLDAGEAVEVLTLLYGALLPSGNDAAMTLALAGAGSEAAFVQRMNVRAAAWGLHGTHFATPHGLDAPGQVSTPRDLLALGRRALDQPLLATIVSTSRISRQGYLLQNTNELLGLYAGAYGVKTGTTDEAGQVLIAAAARAGGDALSVVMASPDRYADSRQLLDFYFAHWQRLEMQLPASALNRVILPDGAIYTLQTPAQGAARPLLLQRWQAEQARVYRAITLDAAGAPLGVLQIWLGPDKLAELPLIFHRQRPPLPPTPTPLP